jgi:integrase
VLAINQVPTLLDALEFRERVIAHLAIFVGLRPGEILGLQRKHVKDNTTRIVIDQRVYAGDVDTPKTDSSNRVVAVPSTTASLLREWMTLVPEKEDAWVFESENHEIPLRLETLWRRHFAPKLRPHGLEWATFQVMRRTHASLGQDAGIDPKVAADQRGHGIGVSLDVYTRSGFNNKMAAADQLEKAVLNA